MGGLAKIHLWLEATQKTRIGEQLNYFGNKCPNPLHRQKVKENFFPTGSREDRSWRERHEMA